MPPTMHVVSHTHWDREWSVPFHVFRARLVACIDSMFDLMQSDPRYRYFHLDGQTSVLDDYLEVRPEREADLKALIADGRVLAGPWYTQPDEFLVSGEAIVRNLLLGTRIARRFGKCMQIGYLPDAFGQTSQMPQIFAGFAFPAALLFRGVTHDHVRAAFLWRGADGTAIPTIKMSDDDAYSNYLYRLKDTLSDAVPIDEARLTEELRRLRSDSESVAVCDQHLWMDGVDQIFPNPKTPDIIEFANRLMPDAQVLHSTLPEYAEALAAGQPGLSEMRGELRNANRAGRLNALLANVASSHVRLKQANVRLQNRLERVVEPLCALARLEGQEYPTGQLAAAWKRLLQNHAHDSICGCSVDQVHREMHIRFDEAEQMIGAAQDRALGFFAGGVDTTFANGDSAALLFNPLPWRRTGTIVCDLPIPAPDNGEFAPDLVVHDASGIQVSHQLLAFRDRGRLEQTRYDIPHFARHRIYTVALDADVPPFGFAGFRISPAAQATASALQSAIGTAIEDNILRAEIQQDGTLTLTHKASGRAYSGLLALEDRGDSGDGWNWVPPAGDVALTSQGSPFSVTKTSDGPIYSEMRVRVHFALPARDVTVPVEFSLSLRAGSPQLDLEIRVDNHARNHRLRVLFPTDIQADVCHADVAFDVVERPIRQVDSTGWKEPQLGTYPHHSFVCLNDASGGFAVFTAGTMEYEVIDDVRRTVAITLLRSFGRGVGEPHEHMDSQEQGIREFHLALRPFLGAWSEAGILQASREFAIQPAMRIEPPHGGRLRCGEALLQIDGSDVDVTALKKAEDRDTLVLRCVNLTDRTQTVGMNPAKCLAGAYETNLDEVRQHALELLPGGRTETTLAPRRIATVELLPPGSE